MTHNISINSFEDNVLKPDIKKLERALKNYGPVYMLVGSTLLRGSPYHLGHPRQLFFLVYFTS